jgi:hypothetical protein
VSPITWSVDIASTIEAPRPEKPSIPPVTPLLPVRLAGRSSSAPHACASYPCHAWRIARRTASARSASSVVPAARAASARSSGSEWPSQASPGAPVRAREARRIAVSARAASAAAARSAGHEVAAAPRRRGEG